MEKVEIEEIIDLAKKAGGKILEIYAEDFSVGEKSDQSPITKADLASEKIIVKNLQKYGIPILSEETADDKERLKSDYVWLVDPLDGTADFIQKTGEFSVMIGLVEKGQPIWGVIFEPVSGKCYFAEKDGGAYGEKEGRQEKLSVSPENDLTDFRMSISRNHLLPEEIRIFGELRMKKKITMGSAGLKLCRIASGESEVYINSSDRTSEWDTCAGLIILQEAGGKVTDMEGNALTYNNENTKHRKGYVASNGTNHDEIIDALKKL